VGRADRLHRHLPAFLQAHEQNWLANSANAKRALAILEEVEHEFTTDRKLRELTLGMRAADRPARLLVSDHLDGPITLHPFLAGQTLAARYVERNAAARPPKLADAPARACTQGGPDVVRVFRVDQQDGRGPSLGLRVHGGFRGERWAILPGHGGMRLGSADEYCRSSPWRDTASRLFETSAFGQVLTWSPAI